MLSAQRSTKIRVYEFLRAAHVERARKDGWFVLYRRESPDFLVDRTVSRKSSYLRIFRTCISQTTRIVEVNEPLMLAAWRVLVVVVLAWCFRRVTHRSSFTIVSYAIENFDVRLTLASRLSVPVWICGATLKGLLRLQSRSVSLIFGSNGAFDNYRRLGWRTRRDAVVVSALEPRCATCDLTSDRAGFVFVGALEERKGLALLMDGMEAYWREGGSGSLIIAGLGPMSSQVSNWCSHHPLATYVGAATREEVHSLLRGSRVVVALSQRTAEWREQLGLPIIEGLSHGCAILTTAETGLAAELIDRGMTVLGMDECSVANVAAALAVAEGSPIGASVLEMLPLSSGRADVTRRFESMSSRSYRRPTRA